MKKLITLLALFFTLSVSSQNVIIYFATPTHACPGDTITVFFRWNNHIGATTFRMIPQFGTQQAWPYVNGQFYYLPKTLIGVDTIYEVKLPTIIAFPQGFANLTCDLITMVPMYFACDVGIKEQELDPSIPIYYDLYGNKTALRSNEILIEQRDRNRRKILSPQ